MTVTNDAGTRPGDPYGTSTEQVAALLARLGAEPNAAGALAAHAPLLAWVGDRPEMFCPNADSVRYLGLARYRAMVRGTHRIARRFAEQVDAALAAVDEVCAGFPAPALEAVRDAVGALVVRGHIHQIAYETLTRAVRQTLGPIHPGDGPLFR